MTRLRMAGRWAQVLGAVLAWIVFVPLIELVRATAQRLGRDSQRRDGLRTRGRVAGRTRGSPPRRVIELFGGGLGTSQARAPTRLDHFQVTLMRVDVSSAVDEPERPARNALRELQRVLPECFREYVTELMVRCREPDAERLDRTEACDMLPWAVFVVFRPNALGFALSTRIWALRLHATAELTRTSALTVESLFDGSRAAVDMQREMARCRGGPVPMTGCCSR